MSAKEFDEGWKDDGLQAFAVRHLSMKRNQSAQTVKLKMFAPIAERRVNDVELLNAGIGMTPYKCTHDETSEWISKAKLIIPK